MSSITTVTKVIKPALNPAMKNMAGLRQVAGGPKNIFGNTGISGQSAISKGHMNYLKSLREPNMASKAATFEDKLAELISGLIPHDLKNRVDSVGTSKVALEMVRRDTGTDYGKLEELSLVKAAAILGTKLALHRKEFKDILGGLDGLRDL